MAQVSHHNAIQPIPDAPIWRLKVQQYHAMIQAGILTADDPVELLEGWLVTKMPKSRRHSLVTQLIREVLAQAIPSGWYVDAQEPLTTADSEPEPDVMIVRGQRRDYVEAHPGPEQVALVVEVADATLQRDRNLKRRLYAAAGMPVYWVVNLPEQRLEVFSGPAEGVYQREAVYTPGEAIPVMLDGQVIVTLPIQDMLS